MKEFGAINIAHKNSQEKNYFKSMNNSLPEKNKSSHKNYFFLSSNIQGTSKKCPQKGTSYICI